VPLTPDTPTTSPVLPYTGSSVNDQIEISWSAPANGGNALIGFSVEIQGGDGNFYKSKDCPLIALRTVCRISMIKLNTAISSTASEHETFGLEWG
jgi:hypothetical protein